MEPDDLLCSRNARPEKALVGRAQWKINQPPSLKRERVSLEKLLLVARCGLFEHPEAIRSSMPVAGAYRIFQRRDPYEPSFSATC